MTVGIVVLVVVVILVGWFIAMYNGLVKLRNNRENAFANIDVQLKQRYDLVPQLVETIKGYAAHEKETLEKVTAARAAAMNATTVDEKLAADKALSGALAGLPPGFAGSLPRTEGQPELLAVAERTGRHREQAFCRPPLLQFYHPRTEQRLRGVPEQHRGGYVRLQARPHVRGHRKPRDPQQGPGGEVLEV